MENHPETPRLSAGTPGGHGDSVPAPAPPKKYLIEPKEVVFDNPPGRPITVNDMVETLSVICGGLGNALCNQEFPRNTLRRQAQLLDTMTRVVQQDAMDADKHNGGYDEATLVLALRIQKQCMETLKAAAAIDYMRLMIPYVRPDDDY